MDPLSEALRSLRLTGGVFLDARFTAPWALVTQLTPDEWRPVLSNPGHLVAYHFVLEGKMLASVGDGEPIEIGAGEIVLMARNDPHRLASARGLPAINAGDVLPPRETGEMTRVAFGGGGESTRVICGFLGTESRDNALLQSLPPVIKVDVRNGSAHDWIESSVRFAAEELVNGRLTTSNVIVRLSECLLSEAIRHHVSMQGEDAGSYFRGFNDPHIGKALAMIHRDVAADLTVETLASAAALSRSAFMDRFTMLAGMPPIRYLALVRLQTAQRQLRDTAQSIRQVAHSCGYDSEEAFSRAFKREFGISPAKWRDAQKA
jgi:AraC-like DNA-binding protein